MKLDDFNKLVISMFAIFLLGFVVPAIIGSVIDYFLPRCHFGICFPIMVWIETTMITIAKKKEKKNIPGPGNETPYDNNDIPEGGKI